MKSNVLIQKARQIPEIETELSWYLNHFGENGPHPWEVLNDKLYTNFKIALPAKLNKTDRQLLIVLTIMVRNYQLVQGDLPGTYQLNVEGEGLLDEIENTDAYLIYSFARLIEIYYGANKKNELRKLEQMFLEEIQKWNWNPWVKQEEVMALLGRQLKEVAGKVSVPERRLPEVFHDYYTRIDRLRLENLDSFLDKSEDLLSSSAHVQARTQFFSYIVGEVKNGGQNLQSEENILPHYSGIKYN